MKVSNPSSKQRLYVGEDLTKEWIRFDIHTVHNSKLMKHRRELTLLTEISIDVIEVGTCNDDSNERFNVC